MNQEATQIDPTEQSAQTEPTTVEEVRNPEAVLAKNKDLLSQIRVLKNELSEFRNAQEKSKEMKMIEEGKYKELLEEREKRIAELEPYRDETEKYRGYFSEKLEKAKEGLSEVQIRAIDGFNGSLSEKLAIAEEFKALPMVKTSSPASTRPGLNTSAKFDIKDYMGKEGQARLIKLSFENKPLYEEILKAKRSMA